MRNTTRVMLNAFVSQIALLSGVASATEKFNVEPSVQQKLEQRTQETSEFLSRINVTGVVEKSGEILGLGIGGPIVSNTNTDNKERKSTDPTGFDGREYECLKNNSDTELKYAKLDAWAKFPNFQTMIRDLIIKRQALDRLLVGFNGTHYEKDSDSVAFPLRQDVNIGWLQKMREENAPRVLSEVAEGSEKVVVGAGGDYNNLDALVYDMRQSLLPTWAKDDTELVVMVGSDLLNDKYFPLINQEHDPENQLARDIIMSTKRLGGLQAVTPPHFPANAILITRYDNLSIYYQESSRRRHIKDKPERDRIINYESSNDAYVIEDLDYACMAENIEVLDPADAAPDALA